MARTFITTDTVVAATSASLDAAATVFTLLIEHYPTTNTSGNSLAYQLNPGVAGWNLRLPDANGNIELRYIRATTNVQYITNDTPLGTTSALRRIMVTVDTGASPIVRIYHDEATPGTLAGASYSTEQDGSGTLQSAAGLAFAVGKHAGRSGRVAMFKRVLTTSEGDAWFAEPRGDDTDCQLFWCLGSSSPEKDFSGTTSGTMNRNPGTVTGTSVSSLSSAALAYVERTIGSGSRMVAHVSDFQTNWLNGLSLTPATGNLRLVGDMYEDSVFSWTAAQSFSGFTAESVATPADVTSKGCVLLRAAPGAGYVYPGKSAGVRWRRTTAPTASEYLWDTALPGIVFEGIVLEYTGGTVSADSIQARAFRIDYAASGGSHLVRVWMYEFNTVRAAASVVGVSVPGGSCHSCIMNDIGVGQDSVSTRNFSGAPNGAYTIGFYGCTAVRGGGQLYRLLPNHASAVVEVRNSIGILDGTGGGEPAFKHDTSLSGTISVTYSLSDDASADDSGGAGNIINATAADLFRDLTGDDFRLKAGSPAIGVGTDLGNVFSKTDVLGFDRDAAGVTWDIGAEQYQGVAGALGTFALAGQAAGTYAGRKLFADAGAFT